MKWSDLKLWKKMSVGIGGVLLLLAGTSLWTIYGLSETVRHGHEVITGTTLRSELLQREIDHLNWAKKVSLFLLDDGVRELAVELDPTQCGFGKWYYGEGRKKAEAALPALKELLIAIEEPHRELHNSAEMIRNVYSKTGGDDAGKLEAQLIFSRRTSPNLLQVQEYFGRMNEISRKSLLTEEEMTSHASETRNVTIVISIVAVLAGLILGWVITRSITLPLVKGVEFSRLVASGDLTGRLDITSRDEVGTLADALNAMVLRLREMVGRISESSTQLISAAGEISSGTLQLEKAAQSQAVASEETSGTITQMAASINTVAQNADSLAGSADEITASVREVGTASEEMARSADTMASAVSETSATIEQMTISIDKVARNAEQLASAVSETSATIEQMTVSIDQVADNAHELQEIVTDSALAIQQMTASIRQVAGNVEETDAVAKTAAKEGAAGLQAGHDAVEAMTRVAEVIENTSGAISSLGRRSEEIGSIVKVINEIADQTNLLALNAAIEAARAGDAGRGFAVVAEEVRKLAERSVVATREIGQVIRQVQEETTESVRLGEIASQEAKASMDLSRLAGGALENIVKSIERTSTLMGQIARMTAEQSVASDQVVQAVERMSQSAAVVANAALEQASGGRQIRIAVERMNIITDEVAGATREQSQGTRQIRAAVENMNNVTGQVAGATKEQALFSRQIVEAVAGMSSMTQIVAAATVEQRKGGEMVVAAVGDISDSARKNLLSVEQLNRSAHNLALQAESLSSLVAEFRTA